MATVETKRKVPEWEAEARDARLRGESWQSYWKRTKGEVWVWSKNGNDWRSWQGMRA